MIKNKKLLIGIVAIYLVMQAILGVLLQTSQGEIPINLRYTAVVFACAFFVLFAEKSLSYVFTQIALLCTVGADYFLVYLPEIKQLPAMIFFSVVQIAYFLRLYIEDENKTRRKINLILRAVLSVVVLIVTALVLGESCDAVALVSMFYYVNLILNVVFGFISFKKNPILAIGLLLFILCDTVVGLASIGPYFNISKDSLIYKMTHPSFDLVWAFYLPSQALLSISLLPKKFKKSV